MVVIFWFGWDGVQVVIRFEGVGMWDGQRFEGLEGREFFFFLGILEVQGEDMSSIRWGQRVLIRIV